MFVIESETKALYASLEKIDRNDLPAPVQLQTRTDRKYFLTQGSWLDALTELSSELLVVETQGLISNRYETTYFDTADFLLHRAAAFSRRNRFKARVRSYLDAELSFLELKLKTSRSRTRKVRAEWDFPNRAVLDSSKIHWIESQLENSGFNCPTDLQPVHTNRFERTTFVSRNFDFRITADTNLSINGNPIFQDPATLILETKSVGHATSVDRVLWSAGIRPQSVSKYGIAVAITHAEQPHNKWHRLIESCFVPQL